MSGADENGDLGPVYGETMAQLGGKDGKVIDQISDVIEQIKKSRQSPPDRERLERQTCLKWL